MAKSKNDIPEKQLRLYNELISNHPEIERKGKTVPYTSLNGHMFSFLDKEGTMGLRLSKKDYEEFIEKYNTPPMIQYGKVMREYVVIPDYLFEDIETLTQYLQKSYDYIATLKPKPTKE